MVANCTPVPKSAVLHKEMFGVREKLMKCPVVMIKLLLDQPIGSKQLFNEPQQLRRIWLQAE